MTEQTKYVEQLKNIVDAILENKRILVYRNEINKDLDNYFTLYYNDNDSDYDILTIPFILENLKEEKDVLIYFYETEKFNIDELSELIVDYIDYKKKSCLTKHLVYSELLRLIDLYNYKISEDYSNFNKNTFSGEIKYLIMFNSDKYSTITEKIEYCNYCMHDKNVSVGVQKCVTYKLE
ncbi:hypothetical protein [Sulfolobus islandicus rudivirus 1 variant XX]|uniref:Uncharacterized protein n=1 Tax=Sulfolobus islandicus rod-shaped virus 1 TaxID=157898 RepID=Q5TJA3_SIRV1|nr:hypothetical protein [Sulfolobus islandicus rudivirus 1 variant XX]